MPIVSHLIIHQYNHQLTRKATLVGHLSRASSAAYDDKAPKLLPKSAGEMLSKPAKYLPTRNPLEGHQDPAYIEICPAKGR